MVKVINKEASSTELGTSKTLYQCEECSLKYEEKEWAEKCEAWCREHHSCHLEIISHAVQEL